MSITSANQVVAQAVSWLWPDRLPLGKLVILDGDPDLGKSLIALDLCARLSTGRPLPDGQPCPGPANALVLSAEDNAADTIVPRSPDEDQARERGRYGSHRLKHALDFRQVYAT